MATSTWMSISGFATSKSSALWPAPWAPTRSGEKPTFRRPARYRTRLTPSGLARNSATANAARKPAAPGPPRRPTPKARCAPMANGERSSPSRMRSRADVICSTWSNCSWSTKRTNSSSFSTASSSTAARARSGSKTWSVATPTYCCGRTTTPNWIGHSATALSGSDTTPAAPETTPVAWSSRHRWSLARNSAFWKNTVGVGSRSSTRPNRSRSSPSGSTCSTSASTRLALAMAYLTWCATSTRVRPQSITASTPRTSWYSRPRTRSRAAASSGTPAGPT